MNTDPSERDGEAGDDAAAGALSTVHLPAGTYTVEQSLLRNKYAVYGPDGELVLRGKQKLFKVREEFPFVDADGEPAFTVEARNVFDVAGDYAVVDEGTGDVVAVLSKNFTFFRHSWTVKTPDGRAIAEVRSASLLLELLRNVSALASVVPHRYAITDPDGNELGAIRGQFSIRDRYELEVREVEGSPTEALVASVVAIDALEGN